MTEWIIETNYGYGWEEESAYDNKADAERDMPEYQLHMKRYNGRCRLRKIERR